MWILADDTASAATEAVRNSQSVDSWTQAQQQAQGQLSEWVTTIQHLWQTHGITFLVNLACAALIFFVGRFGAKLLTRFLGRLMEISRVDAMLVSFLTNLIYMLLLTVVVMAALERLGISTTSLTAVLAAAGFAIGMALQGSLGNFAAGIMLIIFKPFKVGDSIEAGGSKGIVEQILIFNTILRTSDNVCVVIPNNSITAGNIINYDANDTRRIDLTIGCSYSDDLKAVKAFLAKLLEQDSRILKSPSPSVSIAALADFSVNFEVRPWVKKSDHGSVKSDLMERIKVGFDERGFTIPCPVPDIVVHAHPPAKAA